MQTELKSNLKSETFWVRTLFIIAFFIVFRFLDILVIVVTLAQWLFMLFSGKPNAYLQQFSAGLAQFSKQIIDYLGYCSSDKPFPFQDWPESKSPTPSESGIQASSEFREAFEDKADFDAKADSGLSATDAKQEHSDSVSGTSEPSASESSASEPR